MELKARKGFVYTMEAIIGSALVLGVVLSVIPEFQQSPSLDPRKQVHSGLETLDATGNLTDNLSTGEIKSELSPYVPDAYNHSVEIIEVETASGTISAPYEEYMNSSGSSSELQLWIDSSSGLNVTFDGEKVLDQYSSSGYEKISLSRTEGWLNFTGSGQLDYRFDTYSSSGEEPDADTVSVASYLVHKNGTKEIMVRLWQ